MALNILILLSLLKLAVTIPDPNVNVGVDVRVDNEGNGCCGGSKKSCNFGGITYPNKYMLTITCMEFQCMDGCWEYTDKFDHNCGNCTFGGEPLIYTFDNLNSSKPYSYNGTGTYSMAQPGFATPGKALFGVNGHFTVKPPLCGIWTDCIDGVTYYEPGISVTLTFSDSFGYPSLPIKAYVNGERRTIGNKPCKVHTFYGTDGAILVFRHAHIYGGGQNCMSVIGTKGLTVSLCEHDIGNWSDPWAYIYASPDLKAPTSELYGLCNTYTGDNADCFTDQNGTCVPDWQCGTTWQDFNGFAKNLTVLCDEEAKTWEVKP